MAEVLARPLALRPIGSDVLPRLSTSARNISRSSVCATFTSARTAAPSPVGNRHRIEGLLPASVLRGGSKGKRRRDTRQPVQCSAEPDNGFVKEEAPGPSNQSSGSLQTLDPEELEPVANYDLARRDVDEQSPLQGFLFPDKEELPDDVEMSIWDHLEELRERVLVSVGFVGAAILGCFAFAKDLVLFLEAPVTSQGVRFLQLSPGEYFFVTLKVAGYSGLLLGSPIILYEIIAFVLPGLTRNERKFLAPIVLGSSILFYLGLSFSYIVLVPAALNFFVNYGEGVVESIWSIDQYFEFVLILLLSTGLSFQVPVIQLLLGGTGLVTADQMFGAWKYVVVGAVTAAAVLTPSTDPLTQLLLAGPLIGLYLGGAWMVKAIEKNPA